MVPMGFAALRDTEPGRPTALLAAGDLLAIVAILTVGMLRHGVNPLELPGHATMVLGPFLLGWVVGAPLLGAYASPAVDSWRGLVATGTNAWLVAALVGLVLRATQWFPGGVTGLFGIVVVGFGLLAIGAWRSVYGFVAGR